MIRWVLLLQDFEFELKDRNGTKNQVVNHLSRLKNEAMRELGGKAKIDDTSPYEHVLSVFHDLIPRFTDFANYLASDINLSDFCFHQRKNFMHYVKKFFSNEPIYIGVVLMGLLSVVC